MFEFILCINWKSVLWCPWRLLYWCPWLVKFVKLRCKQKGVFHVFLDNKLRFEIITEMISANPALDKTFAFTIIKKTDWYRVVTNHIDVHHGRTREGKLLVMALNWLYCSCLWRYTSKTWYQELKKRRLFCCYWSGDFLWYRLESESVSVHGI